MILHLGKDNHRMFVDDMDARIPDDTKSKSIEEEADQLAMEALIPAEIWDFSIVRVEPTTKNVYALSEDLRIHPACIAGRIRHENNNFRLLSRLVGSGEIRKLFTV